jgi:hypothetical protein
MLLRRVAAWKILGIILLLLAACVAGLWLWTRSRADAKWKALGEQFRELKEQIDRRGGPRKTYHADPDLGNAWDEYDLAVQGINSAKNYSLEVLDLFNDYPRTPETGARRAQIVEASPGALEHLRRGARKRDANPPLDWDQPVAALHTPGLDMAELGLVSLMRVQQFRTSGRLSEAVDLLLDTVVLAHDVSKHAFLDYASWGLYLLNASMEELRTMATSTPLPGPELAKIERELQALEADFPREGAATLDTVVQVGLFGLRGVTFPDTFHKMFGSVKIDIKGPIRPGWRFVFSERAMDADAFDRLLSSARQYSQTNSVGWQDAQELEKRVGEALLDSPANGRADGFSFLFTGLVRHRSCLARVRLLRAAARYLVTGQVLNYSDPFGGNLLHVQAGKSLKVWSVGPDGVDDGGDGDWDQSKGKDIVLEIHR